MSDNASQDIFGAVGGAYIAPADADNIEPQPRALYIGTTGNLSVIMADGSDLIFNNVPVGIFSIQCRRVKSTGTTASDIIGLY